MSPFKEAYAEAAMLIRKPIDIVFNAFIDPEQTTKFWFTKSSGKLEEGKQVTWSWEMFNVSDTVTPITIIPNRSIIIQWGENPDARVEWSFEEIGEHTFVKIVNTGFKGDTDQLLAGVRDATGGFSWVLAGLKAYLEHDLLLNLISDRFPSTK